MFSHQNLWDYGCSPNLVYPEVSPLRTYFGAKEVRIVLLNELNLNASLLSLHTAVKEDDTYWQTGTQKVWQGENNEVQEHSHSGLKFTCKQNLLHIDFNLLGSSSPFHLTTNKLNFTYLESQKVQIYIWPTRRNWNGNQPLKTLL